MITRAGLRRLDVPCEATRETVPAFVLYPTAAEEREVLLGRYPASLAPDAPVHRGPHPVVLVSHGTGSSPFLHRTLAAHLARRGFVVALVEHPRNNRDCDDLAGTDTVLRNRPLHLGAVLGHVLADGDLGRDASGVGVGVVGHSLGGCTALALAGGRPTAFGHETPDGAPAAVPVAEDDRIRALVLLAPATPWFMAPGSLAGVRPPVLVFTGSRDEHTPAWHGRLVEAGVAGPVDHRVVDGARPGSTGRRSSRPSPSRRGASSTDTCARGSPAPPGPSPRPWARRSPSRWGRRPAGRPCRRRWPRSR